MNGKMYRVKEVAELSGVTVRTLHHYDRIGLLVPSGRTDAGYRLYDEDDLLRLQQILIGRELGLPLEQIQRLMSDPELDRRQTLLAHREQLAARARRTEAMIRSVDAALAALEGDKSMEAAEIFEGFDPSQYEEEVRQRWGDTDAYKEAARRTGSYSKEDWVRIQAENDDLMRQLAARLTAGASSDDEDVLELAEGLRLHIDRWYYPCSHAMHVQLADMYEADPRFTSGIDRHGAGLTPFVAAAIRGNAARFQGDA